jgi:interleukin-1 receptor-associated kinase 1
MGHFDAAPKPLTWRQKLRAVLQATEALVYLHTPDERKPRTLHRDFKPANILLDERLTAFIGDTGFAKAAWRFSDTSKMRGTTAGRIMGTPGYAEQDVINGKYSESTDGYAVGITLLVMLTNMDPVDIEDKCCEMAFGDEERPFDDIPPEQLREPIANWPVDVAGAIKGMYIGLCKKGKRFRLKLPNVLETLRGLLQAAHAPNDEPAGAAAASMAAMGVGALPSPFSQLARGMRRDDPQQSVPRNVVDTFATLMRLLDEVFRHSSDAAPTDFRERLDYWRSTCGLPDAVHARMHKLRIWRNAGEHWLDRKSQQRWARDGPRDEDEASAFIAELYVSVTALATAEGSATTGTGRKV